MRSPRASRQQRRRSPSARATRLAVPRSSPRPSRARRSSAARSIGRSEQERADLAVRDVRRQAAGSLRRQADRCGSLSAIETCDEVRVDATSARDRARAGVVLIGSIARRAAHVRHGRPRPVIGRTAASSRGTTPAHETQHLWLRRDSRLDLDRLEVAGFTVATLADTGSPGCGRRVRVSTAPVPASSSGLASGRSRSSSSSTGRLRAAVERACQRCGHSSLLDVACRASHSKP